MGLGFRDRDGIAVCLYLAGGMLSQSPHQYKETLRSRSARWGLPFSKAIAWKGVRPEVCEWISPSSQSLAIFRR